MESERSDSLIGIDCGASKVLLQSAKINPKKTIISKGKFYKEYLYSSHPEWDPNYQPTPLDVQIKENNNKCILIRKAEKKQGDGGKTNPGLEFNRRRQSEERSQTVQRH